jgi:hypothetical protein
MEQLFKEMKMKDNVSWESPSDGRQKIWRKIVRKLSVQDLRRLCDLSGISAPGRTRKDLEEILRGAMGIAPFE